MERNMKAVRVLDLDFNLLCEIRDYEYLGFGREYSTYGSFELRINRHRNNAKYLKKGNLIILNREKIGIIEYRESSIGGNNGKSDETITIKGFTFSHILSSRVCKSPLNMANWEFSGPSEKGIKKLISYNLGEECTEEKRKVNQVKISPTRNEGVDISVSYRLKPVDECVKDMCEKSGLGIKTILDYQEKKIYFEVYEGKDRTQNQSGISRVIFSTDFGNVSNQILTDSTINYSNAAIVAGQGEGTAREIIQVFEGDEEPSGIQRREMFVDARDVDNTKLLKKRGKEKLDEQKPIYTLEGDIRPYNTFQFEKDYDLGDMVTIKFKDVDQTIIMNTRITGVYESWSKEGYDVQLTFGNKVPNVITNLVKMIKDVNVTSTI